MLIRRPRKIEDRGRRARARSLVRSFARSFVRRARVRVLYAGCAQYCVHDCRRLNALNGLNGSTSPASVVARRILLNASAQCRSTKS